MEFQLVEFELKSFKRRNSASPARHCAARRPYRQLCSSAPLHASAVDDPRTPCCASLSGRSAVSRFSSLPSSSSSSSGARSSRVTVARRTGHCSPPRLDSSRPELRNLAPKLVHPSTSAAVPYPGRIGLAPSSDRRSPSPFPPSSAPLRRAPSPRSPPPKIDPR